MSCLLHLRLTGSLVDVARAMRVFRRYSISLSRISLAPQGSLEVATVCGMLSDARRPKGLADALSRIPGVLEAVISHDEESVVVLSCAPPWKFQITTRKNQ